MPSDIRLGDPVIDQANGRAMVVVEDHDETAAEWSDRNNYDLTENYGNERCGTTDTDRVYECIYVASLQSEPSKTYAFPESRLGRPAYERASDTYGRIYDAVARDILERLFAVSEGEFEGKQRVAIGTAARHAGIDDAVVDEARELAEVDPLIGGDD